jgi:hypothetical protein
VENPKIDVMKKILFYFLLSLFTQVSLLAQDKDSIIYILPDRVELKLNEYIEKYDNKGKNVHFCFYLENKGNDTFKICIYEIYNSNPGFLEKRTTRFILINLEKYPVIFDYDTYFSTNKTNDMGEIGNREGKVLRSYPIFDGYSITFDKVGKFIYEDWGILKKRQ